MINSGCPRNVSIFDSDMCKFFIQALLKLNRFVKHYFIFSQVANFFTKNNSSKNIFSKPIALKLLFISMSG